MIFTLRLPDDPGLTGLRPAVRAAVVMPVTFAFSKLVIGDVQTTTFAAFGCFAFLVLADFGGPRGPRAAAYVTTALVGTVLVTVGTLASSTAWSAAAGMLLVALIIQFAGVFGSYVAAAQTALLLSFVLAVSIPAPASAIGARLTGWLLAGAVSTLAGVFFWPRFERLALRRCAAEACHTLAELVAARREHPGDDVTKYEQAARAAIAEIEHRYRAAPKRPAGPARRDRAFFELMSELGRALEFATAPFSLQTTPNRPCIEEGDELTAAVVQTLKGSARVLTGGDSPDLLQLERARLDHRAALDRWAEERLRHRAAPEEVLDGLEADHMLRVLSYLALAIGGNAVIAAGRSVPPYLRLPAGTPLEGTARPLIRVVRTIRTHLDPTSSVLHQSLRVAVGLALAVLVGRLLELSHAFWVVLGTLSVLRSNALGTGRSALEALAGTAIGVAVGAAFTVVAGAGSDVLWVALPFAVFLAAYASSTISFILGQAGFSIVVIILFNLISPVGWRLGLARIEDVAIGTGISLAVGLLLWPRGARVELGRALAELYRSDAAYLDTGFNRLLARRLPDEPSLARKHAVQARDLAGEAFEHFMTERGAKMLSAETAAFLVATGTHAILVGDLLNVVADMGYQAGSCAEGVAMLEPQLQSLLAEVDTLAGQLATGALGADRSASVSDAALRQASLTCLRHWRDDPETGRAAIAVVVAAEWLQQLARAFSDLRKPVALAARTERVPWWR